MDSQEKALEQEQNVEQNVTEVEATSAQAVSNQERSIGACA